MLLLYVKAEKMQQENAFLGEISMLLWQKPRGAAQDDCNARRLCYNGSVRRSLRGPKGKEKRDLTCPLNERAHIWNP